MKRILLLIMVVAALPFMVSAQIQIKGKLNEIGNDIIVVETKKNNSMLRYRRGEWIGTWLPITGTRYEDGFLLINFIGADGTSCSFAAGDDMSFGMSIDDKILMGYWFSLKEI